MNIFLSVSKKKNNFEFEWKLYNEVIRQIEADVKEGKMKENRLKLLALLSWIPYENLLNYLPENKAKKFKKLQEKQILTA